ncbi:MAG: AMP-binding protein [Bacteroidales bacterium]|jgi:long-chain acyl-CoA synthetase|nr:AMP-binding protein [Bacteroidales bacterium]
MIKERLTGYIEQSIRQNWNREALSNYREQGYSYREIAGKILQAHIFFRNIKLKEGDKIALVGRNSANWCVVYLAAVTYGAAIVPVLPDFRPEDIAGIIDHSDAVLLYVDGKIFETLDTGRFPQVKGTVSLDGFGLLSATADVRECFDAAESIYAQQYHDLKPEDVTFGDTDYDRLAVISYTSGTTGFSKGVMISHNSLACNIRFAQHNMPLNPGDPVISFLPLAHTYGCAFEFLFPLSIGCHITILTKTPSPQILVQAFREIKPSLILSVPLVIEKIYKKQILPLTGKPHMRVLLAIPGINRLLYGAIRRRLVETFGGRFREIVIGGAAFNADAERFFRKAGLRFTVGYGMTECGPLISYRSWNTTQPGASGKAIDTLEVTIDSPDPQKIVGEIILRGENVMMGYYKNEKATSEMIDSAGWMHTGDLGIIDAQGNIYIKGRSKSMILGPSGKNIYPEEIEAVINNRNYVVESLVVNEANRLVALVYPDYEALRGDNITDTQFEIILEQIRKEVNERFPEYMAVSKCRIHPDEFAKTPKRSIKRYLYAKE